MSKQTKKLPAFTLVEVLVASLIFVTVLMMVAASFVLIKRSNDNTDDSRVTDTCSRQIEDYLKALIVSSNYSGRIMGLVESGGYKLVPPTEVNGENIIGFASFIEEGKYNIILKNGDDLQYKIYERSYTGDYDFTTEHQINLSSSGGKVVLSSECRTMPGLSVEPFVIDVAARFPNKIPEKLTSSDIADLVYRVRLNDVLFRHIGSNTDFDSESSSASEANSTSKINVDVTNSLNSL